MIKYTLFFLVQENIRLLGAMTSEPTMSWLCSACRSHYPDTKWRGRAPAAAWRENNKEEPISIPASTRWVSTLSRRSVGDRQAPCNCWEVWWNVASVFPGGRKSNPILTWNVACVTNGADGGMWIFILGWWRLSSTFFHWRARSQTASLDKWIKPRCPPCRRREV